MPGADPRKQSDSGEQMSQEESAANLSSCWPRLKSASTKKTRAPKALHQPRHARGSLRGVLRRAAPKVEDKGTENFPEQGGKKLWHGELIMIVTVNHDGARALYRSGARLGQARRWTAGPKPFARAAPFGASPRNARQGRPGGHGGPLQVHPRTDPRNQRAVTPFRRLRTGAASAAAPACPRMQPLLFHELFDAPPTCTA